VFSDLKNKTQDLPAKQDNFLSENAQLNDFRKADFKFLTISISNSAGLVVNFSHVNLKEIQFQTKASFLVASCRNCSIKSGS